MLNRRTGVTVQSMWIIPVFCVLMGIGVPVAASAAAYTSARQITLRSIAVAEPVLHGARLASWPITLTYGGRMFGPNLYTLHVSEVGLGLAATRTFVGRWFYPQWWFTRDEVAISVTGANTMWRPTKVRRGLSIRSHSLDVPALRLAFDNLDALNSALEDRGYSIRAQG